MLVLNLHNVEDLIFYDRKVHKLIPDLQHIIEQWLLAQKVGYMHAQRKKALLDMLNSLNENHLRILGMYFNHTIIIDKIDYHIVNNYSFPIDEVKFDGFSKNFTISRDQDRVYITDWK